MLVQNSSVIFKSVSCFKFIKSFSQNFNRFYKFDVFTQIIGLFIERTKTRV